MSKISTDGNVFIAGNKLFTKPGGATSWSAVSGVDTTNCLLSGNGLVLFSATSIREATDQSWSTYSTTTLESIGGSIKRANPELTASLRYSTIYATSGCGTGSRRWLAQATDGSMATVQRQELYRRYTDIGYPVAISNDGQRVVIAYASEDLTTDFPYASQTGSSPSATPVGSPKYEWWYGFAVKSGNTWVSGDRLLISSKAGTVTTVGYASWWKDNCSTNGGSTSYSSRYTFDRPVYKTPTGATTAVQFTPKFNPMNNSEDTLNLIVHQWVEVVGTAFATSPQFVGHEMMIGLRADGTAPTGFKLSLLKDNIQADTTQSSTTNTSFLSPYRTHVTKDGTKLSRTYYQVSGSNVVPTSSPINIYNLDTSGNTSGTISVAASTVTKTNTAGTSVTFNEGVSKQSPDGVTFWNADHTMFLNSSTLALRSGSNLIVYALSGSSLTPIRYGPTVASTAVSPSGFVTGTTSGGMSIYNLNL